MNYPVLIIFAVLIFGLNTAYGLPPPPPTNFVVTITNESNQPVQMPVSLQITEILDGETLLSYGIDLFKNPQTVSIGWYAPSKAENTEIHIVAVKQGYAKSSEFVYKITSQTPTEGKLFDHTFVLKTEETSKVIEKEFKVTSDGKSYTLTTKSSSNVESVEFAEKESSVLMVLDEDSISGFTDLSFPTSLISSPFRTLLDNVVVFPSEEKIGKTTVLHFEYSNGLHTVRVVSQVTTTTEEDFESGFETDTQPKEISVPGWIKNNAGWWADGAIDDSAFLQGIQFLIKEGIMVIPQTETSESSESQEVPGWVKNNASWWADGAIDDNTFVSGIQHLVKVGIIKVS